MATPEVRLTETGFKTIVQLPSVRAALRAEAERRQGRAEGIAAAEGVELDSEIREGTRPKGRPYARVQSPNVGQEYGDGIQERRRVLGRAAEGGA